MSGSAVAQQTMPSAPPVDRRDIVSLASAAPAEWRLLDSIINAYSYFSGGQDPFAYDPRLNILATIKRGSTAQAGAGNQVWIWRSTDLGQTWGAPFGPLTDPTETGAGSSRYPSLIVNPTHSTDPSSFYYVFNAPMTATDGWVAHSMGIIDQSGNAVIPQLLTTSAGTAAWSSDARIIESADGQTIVAVASVDGNAIGVRTLGLESGTITASVPTQVAGTVFIDPETENSRTSTVAGLTRDEAGGIYALIWGRTAGSDADVGNQMPMAFIMKSSDNGATWGDLIPLPGAQFRAYLDAQGFTVDSSSTRWAEIGFTALGPDRLSLAIPYYDYRDENRTGNFLIEAMYTNGTWSFEKIADMNAFPEIDADGSGTIETTEQQVENMVQLVETADGNTLLVKWVEKVVYTSQEDVDGDGNAPDEFVTSDVMVATRPAAGGAWSTKKNVTETPEYDRLVWIPTQVIPNDLTRLPMLEVQGVVNADETTPFAQWVTSQLDLSARTQLVMVTNVDATTTPNAAPVTGTITTSRIASIAPNPTSGSAVLTLEVAKGGEGSVEVWSSLGRRVATLAEGSLQAGTHTYTLNGVELPLGAYYVAMKIDGQTVTRPFSVVR